MKKTVITIMALCLFVGASASAQNAFDLKGKMIGSAYGGYTIGMGDPFGDNDITILGVTTKSSFNPGIGFGATFHYGVAPKIMVGGEIGFQSYKAEGEAPGYTFGGFTIPAESYSSSTTETNILATALYALNYTDDKKAMFLTFGLGMYGGASSEIGVNFGVVYRTMVSQKVGIYVMPRFHYIMADEAIKMIQIAVGASMPLGSK